MIWGRRPRKQHPAYDSHEALAALIALRGDTQELLDAVDPTTFGPYIEPAPVLSERDLARVLRRFLAGGVSADEVAAWAERLELRDDIDYGLHDGSGVFLHVSDLAPKGERWPLTVEAAEHLLEELERWG